MSNREKWDECPKCSSATSAPAYTDVRDCGMCGWSFTPKLSLRSQDWQVYAAEVLEHIEVYTLTQYGDKLKDDASDYTPEYCVAQVRKYTARFGRNARPDEAYLDLLKMGHYAQLAATRMKELKEAKKENCDDEG